MQQQLPLNSIYFYLLLYFGTVLFYTYAYAQDNNSTTATNKRTRWYAANMRLIKISQPLLFLFCLALALYLSIKNWDGIIKIDLQQLLMPALAAFAALSYYGIPVSPRSKFNLRKTGWFKPFAIGFVWATAVTYIPVLWYAAEHDAAYHFTAFYAWFFIKNLMYISMLAILFDIKDYADDHNRKLKTFVVQIGLRKTIFYIIVPLIIIGFVSFIAFASLLHFPVLRIAINSIPFILLLYVALSMKRRKSILYYLIVIDGLMLVKALCGITASLLVK